MSLPLYPYVFQLKLQQEECLRVPALVHRALLFVPFLLAGGLRLQSVSRCSQQFAAEQSQVLVRRRQPRQVSGCFWCRVTFGLWAV